MIHEAGRILQMNIQEKFKYDIEEEFREILERHKTKTIKIKTRLLDHLSSLYLGFHYTFTFSFKDLFIFLTMYKWEGPQVW